MNFIPTFTLSAAATLVLPAALALAGPWATPSGSRSAEFSFANGANDADARFGSPVATLSGFSFLPNSWTSGQPFGVASAPDRATVDLAAAPQRQFSFVTASLLGDYSGLGPFASTSAAGTVTLTNLDTSATRSAALVFTPEPPYAGSQNGVFSGTATVALPAGWKNVGVEYAASLTSAASGGSVDFIEAKSARLEVGTGAEVVPLPAAALAAIPAFGVAAYLRRKKRK